MKKRLFPMLLALLMLLALAGCATATSEGGGNPIATEAAIVALDIAATAATALIGVVGAWTLAKIGQNKSLSNLQAAIKQVIDAAQLTVGELQQTVVVGLKEAAPDGKLTPAQIEDLKRKLLQKTSEKLTAPAVQLLEAAKLDVNALIQGAAEDMINNMHTAATLLAEDAIIE